MDLLQQLQIFLLHVQDFALFLHKEKLVAGCFFIVSLVERVQLILELFHLLLVLADLNFEERLVPVL